MKVPNVGPVQPLLCKFGWHLRDKRTRHKDGYDITARCRGCGRAMVHDWGGWQLDPRGSPPDDRPPDC